MPRFAAVAAMGASLSMALALSFAAAAQPGPPPGGPPPGGFPGGPPPGGFPPGGPPPGFPGGPPPGGRGGPPPGAGLPDGFIGGLPIEPDEMNLPIHPLKAAVSAAQGMVGYWAAVGTENVAGPPAFKPDFAKKSGDAVALFAGRAFLPNPQNPDKCVAIGMPGMMLSNLWIEANSDYMTVIAGQGPAVRTIWLNGHPHTPANLLFENHGGDATSRWEGNTLVVDTTGLIDQNEITYGMKIRSEDFHIVERFTRKSPNDLEITTTVESPTALSKPWVYRTRYRRQAPNDGFPFCAKLKR